MIKEKFSKWIGLDMQEEVRPLVEVEQVLQVDVDREIKWQEMTQHDTPFNCFGVHYSLKYLKSHTPAEVDARWKSDIAALKRIIEEYRREDELDKPRENSRRSPRGRS